MKNERRWLRHAGCSRPGQGARRAPIPTPFLEPIPYKTCCFLRGFVKRGPGNGHNDVYLRAENPAGRPESEILPVRQYRGTSRDPPHRRKTPRPPSLEPAGAPKSGESQSREPPPLPSGPAGRPQSQGLSRKLRKPLEGSQNAKFVKKVTDGSKSLHKPLLK